MLAKLTDLLVAGSILIDRDTSRDYLKVFHRDKIVSLTNFNSSYIPIEVLWTLHFKVSLFSGACR